jgi:nicotinamide-nucleotide amidase
MNNYRIGLLATGNELTEGDILNTNGQAIAQTLAEQGLAIGLHVIASDVEQDIIDALSFLLQSHSVVIITGGLGPTSDDRTRYALSKVIAQELILDGPTWENISARLIRRGFNVHPANRQQALFPKGAQIIPNANGTAAACYVTYQNKIIYMLPGPPSECLPMFQEFVLPALRAYAPAEAKMKLTWCLTGAIESEVAAQIDAAVKPYPVTTGYRAASPHLEIKIYTTKHAQFDEMLSVINAILKSYTIIKSP